MGVGRGRKEDIFHPTTNWYLFIPQGESNGCLGHCSTEVWLPVFTKAFPFFHRRKVGRGRDACKELGCILLFTFQLSIRPPYPIFHPHFPNTSPAIPALLTTCTPCCAEGCGKGLTDGLRPGLWSWVNLSQHLPFQLLWEEGAGCAQLRESLAQSMCWMVTRHACLFWPCLHGERWDNLPHSSPRKIWWTLTNLSWEKSHRNALPILKGPGFFTHVIKYLPLRASNKWVTDRWVIMRPILFHQSGSRKIKPTSQKS